MKKIFKYVLITIISLIILLLLDSLQALIFDSFPVIKTAVEYNGGNIYQEHKGLLTDTYVCTDGTKFTTFKFKKYDCIEKKDASIQELNHINDVINDYVKNNSAYNNLGFNYVDENKKVVIVGLYNNSYNQQHIFRKHIVDSELLEFVKATPTYQNPSNITISELEWTEKLILNIVYDTNYTNFSKCSIDMDNKIIKVILINNDKASQEDFKKNIINSKYIIFEGNNNN